MRLMAVNDYTCSIQSELDLIEDEEAYRDASAAIKRYGGNLEAMDEYDLSDLFNEIQGIRAAAA